MTGERRIIPYTHIFLCMCILSHMTYAYCSNNTENSIENVSLNKKIKELEEYNGYYKKHDTTDNGEYVEELRNNNPLTRDTDNVYKLCVILPTKTQSLINNKVIQSVYKYIGDYLAMVPYEKAKFYHEYENLIQYNKEYFINCRYIMSFVYINTNDIYYTLQELSYHTTYYISFAQYIPNHNTFVVNTIIRDSDSIYDIEKELMDFVNPKTKGQNTIYFTLSKKGKKNENVKQVTDVINKLKDYYYKDILRISHIQYENINQAITAIKKQYKDSVQEEMHAYDNSYNLDTMEKKSQNENRFSIGIIYDMPRHDVMYLVRSLFQELEISQENVKYLSLFHSTYDSIHDQILHYNGYGVFTDIEDIYAFQQKSKKNNTYTKYIIFKALDFVFNEEKTFDLRARIYPLQDISKALRIHKYDSQTGTT